MSAKALDIYLNDHLGGSRAGLQLLESLIESAPDAKSRDVLGGLRAEIAADRDVLEEIIRRVSGGPSLVREVGGWVGEKVTQLKLMIDDPSNGSLHRFEALELLGLGIEGKSSLWRALSVVASAVPDLAGINFADLVRRAADQRGRVEAMRTEAAREALMPGG